jgi:hypothetical protein
MKKTLLFITAFFTSSVALLAQYEFSTFVQPYQELQDGTNLIQDEIWDDPEFVLPMGFEFPMNGELFTEGVQIGLGAVISFTDPTSALNFVMYNSDLIDGEAAMESPSEVSYEIGGTSGNRICKLQYANCAFFNEVAEEDGASNRVNFQIWFYEADGAIEFRFGSNSITNPQLVHDGGTGPMIGLGLGLDENNETLDYAVALAGDPANPTVTEIDLQSQPPQLQGEPAEGRVYRFAPVPLSTNEVNGQQFSLSPNLVDDQFKILGITKPVTYTIYDITGKRVENGLYTEGQSIAVSHFQPGIYLVSLDGIGTTQKFVKQ